MISASLQQLVGSYFSAIVEAALSFMGVWWDPMRVDYAIRSVDTWYKGDGVYGDGPSFHWD